MSLRTRLGVALLVLAIGTCMLLGSLGWFAVGFGIMTDCTNDYSCSSGSCSPCAAAQRWITLGGITQWVLAAVGVAILVRRIKVGNPSTVLLAGAILLVASLVTAVGTTWAADASYCREGTPGYRASYCSVEP